MKTDRALSPVMSLSMAADLQAHLLAACTDLDRLQVLLAGASEVVMTSFRGAGELLDGARNRMTETELTAVLLNAQRQLAGAVTALQFQDLTSQLVQHTQRRLRGCANLLAGELFCGGDVDAEAAAQAPLHPNPVTQAEMAAGSVELF